MRRSRFTEGQILGILEEHEAGQSAADLCRKHGISDQTLYNWKAKYGGLKPSEASRLKGLEDENRRLKKLLAEAVMDNSVLRELLRKKLIGPAARFGVVERVMREHEYSERAACRLIGVDRSAFRYERADGGDAALRKRLRELANQRRRFGYRRLVLRSASNPAAARGRDREPEAHLAAVSRGAAVCPSAARAQACAGHAGADGGAAGRRPAVEPRLRLRCAGRWSAVPVVVRGG